MVPDGREVCSSEVEGKEESDPSRILGAEKDVFILCSSRLVVLMGMDLVLVGEATGHGCNVGSGDF